MRRSTAARFMFLNHSDLAGITADQHHNQVHVFATDVGLGPDHTISGATAGHVFRATGATTGRIMQLSHSDLGGVTPNQHHNQVHTITGSDHTITGSQFQLVGATGTNTLGLLTPTSNPGAAAAILRTGSSGELTLRSLTVQGNVDVTNGGDLTVGANVFFVDVSGQNVGINRAPDSQFDLDVAGALRATYLVGKHAIQLSGARMILHFDGQEPSNTNFTGELNGHMGQVATTSGAVIFRPGKFGKAVQVGEGTTNLIINPSFETSTGGWSSSWGDTITRSSEQAAYGDWSLKVTVNTTSSSGAWRSQTVTASLPYTFSAWICIPSSWTGPVPSVRIFNGNDFNTLLALTNADNSIRDEWQRITVAATPTLTTIRIVVI
ncbi:MAG: hypothetical protein KJ070_26580, partial [Verrucomicrobia bacterium]|nr:hypothetical protein [Verrucomicrobiota bacterium]